MTISEELFQVNYHLDHKGDTVIEALRHYGPEVLKAHPDIAAAVYQIEMLELAIKTRLKQLGDNDDDT